MRSHLVLSTGLILGIAACGTEPSPTEPGTLDPASTAAADLAANTWTKLGPHRLGTVIGVSFGVLPNAAGQSVVYAFGGCDIVQGSGSQCTVSGVRIYNAVTGAWSGDPDWIGAEWQGNGVGAIGSKLYVTGGYPTHDETDGMSRRFLAYEPATGQTTQLANMPKSTAEGVTGVIDGNLYVLPGACDSNFWPNPGYCEVEEIRRLYRYNPATNKWAARKQAPHFHRGGAAGVIGGKLYVAGGVRGSQLLSHLDVYNPATDSWKTLAPVPKAGRASGTALAGKLYVLVGKDAYVYNPANNRWSSIADPATGHEGVVRVVIDGKPRLLAIGGLGGPHFDQPLDIEVYTP